MHTSYDETVHPQWKELLTDVLSSDSAQELTTFISRERAQFAVYPPNDQVFAALSYFSPTETSVVILGQDPYHEHGQAHGLSFSVQPNIAIPQSLRNIFAERENDIGLKPPVHGTLTQWAQQGVLLLNACLSVEAHKAGSHRNRGWEIFTDQMIKSLNENKENLVFLLWGNYAKSKRPLIGNKHIVLEAAHPSPLSAYRGFFNCKHFSKTNEFLAKHGLQKIDWQIR